MILRYAIDETRLLLRQRFLRTKAGFFSAARISVELSRRCVVLAAREAYDLLKIIVAYESVPRFTTETMITTNVLPAPHSESWTGSSDPKAILLEPLLIAGTALFWLCVLPLTAIGLMAVKVWETATAVVCGRMVRRNPLILRRNSTNWTLPRRRSARVASV